MLTKDNVLDFITITAERLESCRYAHDRWIVVPRWMSELLSKPTEPSKYDDYDWIVNVKVYDRITGKITNSRDTRFKDLDLWYWTEGNGSCDCNRAIMCGVDDEDDDGLCHGVKRFLVIDIEPEKYFEFINECNSDIHKE